MEPELVGTAIIGGGQAGLAVGHHLSRRTDGLLIVDANERTGDSWRHRWDSLRLFTPASFDGLPGMRFPARRSYFPTKDEMADYLEHYAARLDVPIRFDTRVERLSREHGRYVLTAADRPIWADRVVVATGPYRAPKVPSLARELDAGITQIHSARYRNPGQLRDGTVLVVGAGNSGAEIALEAAATHDTLLSGRDTGHIPITLGGLGYRVLSHLSVRTWPGSAIATMLSGRGQPLVRVNNADLARAGVARVPRVDGVSGGRPVLADGRVLDVGTVVWCTGFVPDLAWIDLPVLGPSGDPVHRRGEVPSEPGLYFVGLPFQSSVASQLVGGVGVDAKYVGQRLAARSGPRP